MKKGKVFTRDIFDGAAVLALSAVITKMLGVLYKVPLSRILGEVGLGYFNSAYTVYSFFYILCTAGVPKAVAIVICDKRVKGDGVLEREIVSKALGAFSLFGGALTLLFIFFADELCVLIGNSNAAPTMLAIAPTVLFASVSGVARGALTGNSRLLPQAVAQLIEGGAKFILGIGFARMAVRLCMPLSAVSAFSVLGITLGSLVSAIYLLLCTKNGLPKQRYNVRGRGIIRSILHVSLPLTLGAAVMSITSLVDLSTVMGGLTKTGLTESEAGALYGNYTTLAVPMVGLVGALTTPFFTAALPHLTSSYRRGEIRIFRDEIDMTLRKVLFIAVPSAVAFSVYPFEMLSILFGDEMARVGAPLLALLGPSSVILAYQTLFGVALESSGHYKAPIIAVLLGGIPKIAISYLLIPNGSFGILAAPLGTVAFYVVGFLASYIMLIAKSGVVPRIVEPLVITLISGLSAFALTSFLSKMISADTVLYRAVILVIYALLYTVLYTASTFFVKKVLKGLSYCTKNTTVN